jgi:hypothetical protein
MRAFRYKSNSIGVVERIDVKLQKRDLVKVAATIVVVELLLHKPVNKEWIKKVDELIDEYKNKVIDQVGQKKDPEGESGNL